MSALIPADLSRCQTVKFTWTPFTFGRGTGETRCIERPIFIAEECRPSEDDRMGSMSLCGACAKQLVGSAAGRHTILNPVVRQ